MVTSTYHEDCYSTTIYEEYDHSHCKKATTKAISGAPYPCIKSPNHRRKQNTTRQSSTSNPNKDWYNHPTISNANPNKDSCNQPIIYNGTVIPSTDVQPTPINVPVVSRYTHPYTPAPPSESSIFSDWLLNHPSCNQNDPPIPLEVICRLDYRLRDSA